MKQFMLTIVCIHSIAMLYAQPFWAPLGNDVGAGVYSQHFQDVFTASQNPAGLSCLRGLTAGIYGERRFMLQEAPFYMAMAAVPVGAGAFSAGVTRFGSSAYYQQKISGAYGRSAGRKIGVGAQFNYESVVLPGYGSTTAFSFDAGLLWHVSKKLHTGLHVYRSQGMPLIYSAGAGFEASPDFLLTTEAVKEGDGTAFVKAATCYRIAPQLALLLGMATRPPYNNAGVYFLIHALRIGVSVSIHPQLGITPSTTIIWQQAPAE
ncbi:hypothetical protein [Chitinophaga sp. MM2321]|uniref:hypothetical protein n=1 Tax=Chitinophaga sp. MM2321 TaxID=3137178 RepID=UPI0032D57598